MVHTVTEAITGVSKREIQRIISESKGGGNGRQRSKRKKLLDGQHCDVSFSATLVTYQFLQFGFTVVANQYPSPIPVYNGFAMPNYHPQPIHHSYESVQPLGYLPVSWQPTVPSHPSPPAFNTNRSVSGLQHFRSPSPTFGPSSAGNPLAFPELKDWLKRVDRDSVRGRWGHQFSQFSARFELDGLTSIFYLEGMPASTLVDSTGIHKEATETPPVCRWGNR